MDNYFRTGNPPDHASNPYTKFVRAPSVSSIDTNATAPNLIGAGRTLGRFLDWLGVGLESGLNRVAGRMKFGPVAVAKKVRRARRHDETSIAIRYATRSNELGRSERQRLLKICVKLLGYTQYV